MQFQVAGLVINTVVPCDIKVIWFEQWTGMIGAGACRKAKKKDFRHRWINVGRNFVWITSRITDHGTQLYFFLISTLQCYIKHRVN